MLFRIYKNKCNLFPLLLYFFCICPVIHYQFALSILAVISQVNLGQLVPTEAKDDGGGGNHWTTGAVSHDK